MAFDPKKLIYPMTFVTLTTDAFEKEENGIKKGDLFFVAGNKVLPLSEDDPYTQRVFMYIQPTTDGYVDTTKGFFLVDPKNLENVSEEENTRLLKLTQERLDATTH